MPRPSPFADLTDAVVVELARPSRAAFGCFALTTAFLAVVAVAALTYAAIGPSSSSTALRWLAAVLGVIFLLLVAGLVAVTVKAARGVQGLAFDADGVRWRSDRAVVRLEWAELAAVRIVQPIKIRGIRTSAPKAPSVQFWPADNDLLRRHPELTNQVAAGDAPRPELSTLRLSFALASAEAEPQVSAAVERFAPALWIAGE
ncbi:MAG TPA: hypothetical protein VHW44_16425 [Pseudonocardiaceae bacterium]|jgi:hypothetical protein|nr:hypothetical protein [Pseudonocardiaceae bacterium]